MSASEGASTAESVNVPETKTLESVDAQKTLGNDCSVETSVGNGINAAEGSRKTLEEAAELMEKGSTAVKAGDYAEAAECLSRAVEIRVSHYGELAPECSSAYYKYGCALLYKAQEEADPLGSVPKKDDTSTKSSGKESLSKAEGSVTSSVGDANQDGDSIQTEAEQNAEVKGEAEADDDDGDEGSDGDDEDESDLDLAWKMLDLARAIVEKNPEDTMEKVDILSALGEVALEREDIENSLSDYLNALSILQRLVEPDSRRIAELNFRVCVVLEISSKPEEAIPYCQKAISVCGARVQRLKDEVKNAADTSSVPDKEAEIETLNGLSSDLEKKLEDLQQLVAQPNSFVAEFLKMIAAKSAGNESSTAPGPSSSQLGVNSGSAFGSSQLGTNSSGGGGTAFDSPTLSTAHTKASGEGVVQHLGVVGRGVKRVLVSSTSTDSVASKRPTLEECKDSSAP